MAYANETNWLSESESGKSFLFLQQIGSIRLYVCEFGKFITKTASSANVQLNERWNVKNDQSLKIKDDA